MSVLLLELAVSRIFSVVLFYHYAFLVISLAILGLASGAVLVRLFPLPRGEAAHHKRTTAVCITALLAILPALFVAMNTNVWLVTSMETAKRLAFIFFMFLVPFTLAGYAIASTMVVGVSRVAKLYFYDLLGGSLGCILFVPVVSSLGGVNAVLAAGALLGVAAVVWSIRSSSRALQVSSAVTSILMLLIITVNMDGSLLDLKFKRGLPIENEEFVAWNAFSRVSVLKQEDDTKWIEIDGGAGTWIPDMNLDTEEGDWTRNKFGRVGPDMAFWLRKPRKSMIIGTGGGNDIVRAIVSGSESVTAVEINPIIADDVMLGAYREYSNNLYARPEVTVVIEDGRTFVRRTKEEFDVIQLSQVDTWAASASGAYSLTENYLYTVDAIYDYISKLSPDGLLSISRWEFTPPRETLRLAATVLETLVALGIEDPSRHIVVLLDQYLDNSRLFFGTVIVGLQPFTPEQIQILAERTTMAVSKIAYAPYYDAGEENFRALMNTNTDDRDEYINSYPLNITPTTDDSPFFFFTGRWKNTFRDMFRVYESGDTINTGAQFLLVATLAITALAVVLFLFLPLMFLRLPNPFSRDVLPLLGLALAVGLGYIIVEVAMIQSFIIFLGQPVYSLTVIIFSFLLFSSLGSRISAQFSDRSAHHLAMFSTVAICIVLFVYKLFLPLIISAFQANIIWEKLGITALMVMPLGVLMGIPFPTALRLAAQNKGRLIEWMWSVNASATVFGSVLAVFTFVTVGVASGLLAGSVCYFIYALILLILMSRDQ
jgi:predicted membrane-bound spermidine synthase